MIKANDIRIGNIFKVREDAINTEHYPGDIIKWDLSDFSAIERGRLNYMDFDPIPLTPELLEKCGFELLVGDYDFDTYSKNGIEVWEHDEGYCHSYAFGGDVDHLHQLQNLYFVLTGEELEIKL